MIPKYKRVNLETGNEYIGEFNPSHHNVFSDPDSHSKRTIDKVIDELIANWNWQQPKTWKYCLI